MAETIQEQIVREVSAWRGVTMEPHRFGGIEFRLGRRELGHLHGSRLADLPFPVHVREQLVAAGNAGPHHVLPESGWVSCYIRDAGDVARVVELFRLNYERPWLASRLWRLGASAKKEERANETPHQGHHTGRQ